MKIKIGNKITSIEDEPIMFIFDDKKEKLHLIKNLKAMDSEAHKYCIYPIDMDENEVKEFMNIE